MKFLSALIWLASFYSIQGKSVPLFNQLANDEPDQVALNPEFVSNNTHFLLWTRRNPTQYQVLKTGDETNLKESDFNVDLPTKVFAHGFASNGYSGNAPNMAAEFLKHEDCNFISVDWEKLAAAPNYLRAVASTSPVGVLTGELINFLVKQGADLKQFHVIGFSLGAHVAGKTGATVDGVLPRITGLDPAYPLYSMHNTDKRLDTSDAEFVDVIHTNSGSLFQEALSFPTAIGHADFFVNGGHSQPGCGIHSGDIIDLLSACSHERAPKYFIESINSQVGFRATFCETWDDFQTGSCSANPTNLMGEPVSETTKGTFYLTTNRRSPFARK